MVTRPITIGGIRGQYPHGFFVPPQTLLCPEKLVLNIEQKKSCPHKMYFALQTLKPGYGPKWLSTRNNKRGLWIHFYWLFILINSQLSWAQPERDVCTVENIAKNHLLLYDGMCVCLVTTSGFQCLVNCCCGYAVEYEIVSYCNRKMITGNFPPPKYKQPATALAPLKK